MKAAVITSFDEPPRYQDFDEPTSEATSTVPLTVLAAPLHRLTIGRATGKHYSAALEPPFVPGIDGVGRDPEGQLRYFLHGNTRFGSLAERTVVEAWRTIPIASDVDPVTIAAAVNPAMSAWLALRCRMQFERGQKVLVLGATGHAGSMSVQVARHLGASKIIASGRNEAKLEALRSLGATAVLVLDDPRMGEVASDVDVVLDFVWGEIAAKIMERLVRGRADRSRPLTWIQIGSMAGETSPVPAALLRSSKLHLLGSGLGSVSTPELLEALPSLLEVLAQGSLHIDAKAIPLREIDRAWREAGNAAERVVVTP
ncbi:MAG: zinc-binding alcohol dehydrogenase family protein [Myxococcales bacterium]|jgi:NADPH:quinone reductase-like Zn-dependent oxidoreductase|nr:zinc-binding alcohol dehydrogenase family protein [Myxococcales bacterium]